MYLVAFNKGKGTIRFGPFLTLAKARRFIEEDVIRKQYMKVERIISPAAVRPVH